LISSFKQQTTNNKQQTTNNKQQTTNNKQLPTNKLIGIIACGGSSTRMGRDKSLIDYHGKPQMYYLYDLLKPLCDEVCFSVNSFQAQTISKENKFIIDKEEFKGHGPISGLLSCHEEFSNRSILFLGCDYPFIHSNDIVQLIENRSDNTPAVCFINKNNIPEPLLSVYENEYLSLLLKRFNQNLFSLREFLTLIKAKTITPVNKKSLLSIDTNDEFLKIKKQ
jgi:molybdopterin-guanine dinucleotide biosynthesis protein A